MSESHSENGSPSEGEPTGAAHRAAFQSVIDHVPGAWFFLRHDGSVAYANLGASGSLGYTPDELRALTIFDIDPWVTPEHWRELWTKYGPGQAVTVRARHRRKDGSEFPVEVRASRVYIDGEDLAASYTVDLTLSERTQGLNRRLLAAIEQGSEAVVITDASGAIEYVNPAYVRSTGMSESAVIGQSWASLEIADDGAFLERLASALKEGVGFQGRVEGRRQNGAVFNEDVSVSPLRDDGGRIVGWVAVKRDISERLQLEQRLRQTQKVEAVGQLAGGIAHDFNNLLQLILGQATLIQLSGAPPMIQPMLTEIVTAVERATSLVRQLLAFSRKGTVDVSDVRLDGLITTLHGMLTRLLGEQVELEWTNRVGPVYVCGNPAQLEQAVANLCINARDAMPSGGKLELCLDRPQPEQVPAALGGLSPEGCVVFSVRDNGHGMSEDVQARAFDPFFTTKEPGRGTGLGLASVHAVVQAHKGSISVTSALGEGSTFRIFLPTVHGSGELPELPVRRRTARGQGRLVLVAEDEPGVRRFTASYLEQAGFEVLSAKDGIEAEELLATRRESVSLLVLDAVMPRKGGQSVHEAFCASLGRDVPTVFVTGYDYESLALAQRRSNVVILQKPFSGLDLLTHVATVLGEAG